MRAVALVLLIALAAGLTAIRPVGDAPSSSGEGPTPLQEDEPGARAVDFTAEKPVFTQCEDVVLRAFNPGPANFSLGYAPELNVFTVSGAPVVLTYNFLKPTAIWDLPIGESRFIVWNQRHRLTDLMGNPIPPDGEGAPSGDYEALLADWGVPFTAPAPFTIGAADCSESAVDAGPDLALDEGETAPLGLTASIGPDETLLSVAWDLDATVDSDGNGNQTDDADAAGANVNVTFGDDGVFDVTTNARVSSPRTNLSKVDQDIVFMIDSSGSMQWNDATNARLTAAKAYVDLLVPEDRAAVIDFDDNAMLVPGPDGVTPGDHLSQDYARVKSNIDLVDSFGGTAFTGAFLLLNKEFRERGIDEHTWVAIFLTDAESIHIQDRFRLPQVLNETAALGIRVFPVGLNVPPELDAFMAQVANQTGGQYFPSLNGTDLVGIYTAISQAVESSETVIRGVADTLRVTVANVAPELGVAAEVTAGGAVGLLLRVAGEKYHDVAATLFRNGSAIASGTILRLPGSPDDQAVSLGTVDSSAVFSVEVVYTPLDDAANGRVWGADPAWLILERNGTEFRIHHTFNVRHPDTWAWRVDDLSSFLPPSGVDLAVTATDPGSDDLTVTIDWGDGTTEVQSFPNNASLFPDPDPSIEVNPRAIAAAAAHAYSSAGTYTITVTVEDDDGGVTTATLTVLL